MKRSIIKLAAFIIVSILSIPVIFSQTESGLCLGKIQFIEAPKSMDLEARTLKMKMSQKEISPKFYNFNGGVAFAEIAQPEFKVKSFSLICDKESNAAYALINGSKYKIPLDVWQLQPIAQYADNENNSAVTLFGTLFGIGECQILFHSAFIDKLIGIRLLQTDILLAGNFLDYNDRWKLPSNKNEHYIMSESEKSKWKQDSTISINASKKIEKAIDSINSYFTTYIFTDFEEKITFDINKKNLIIKGLPYYRFYKDSYVMDTMSTYYEILSFLDIFDAKKKEYENTIASKTFDESKNPNISTIKKIVGSEKSDSLKAKEVLNVFRFIKTNDRRQEIPIMIRLLSNVLNQYFKTNEFNNNDPRMALSIEIKKILDEHSVYSSPALVAYTKQLIQTDPTNPSFILINNVIENIDLNNDDILQYIFANPINTHIYQDQITKYLKGNPNLVHDLNPIVIDAAYATCQWSAFFRYAKQENPQNWESFLKQVEELKYDAPQVNTPIGFGYKKD